LLPSGKTDRKALARMELAPAPHLPAPESAASETLEDTVLRHLRSVLMRAEAGPASDFFELGGHSLRAADLAARLQAELNRPMGLRDVFLHPTARRLAAALSGRDASARPIGPAPEGPVQPLSHAQRRLFALDAMRPGSCADLIAGMFRLDGDLDAARLERAFAAVIDRHEVLRTAFCLMDGTPQQFVESTVPFSLHVTDLSRTTDPDGAARHVLDDEAARPFDLASAPLVRARLLTLGEARHALIFVIHHIVADGWSLGVMLDDLDRAYQSDGPLPPACTQYRDYAARERAFASSERAQQGRDWWKAQLTGELPVVDLPLARPRPARRADSGGSVPFALDAVTAAGLDAVARENKATSFMLLLAALAALVHRNTGMTDIVLGSVSGMRDQPDLAQVVGCFVNPLALRLAPQPDQSFAGLLCHVRSVTLAGLEHAATPFDVVVRDVGAGANPGRTPLFDIGLSWNALPHMARHHLAGCAMTPLATPGTRAKYDLLLIASSGAEGIAGSLEYAADLFDPASAGAIASQLQAILSQVAADADVKLRDLRLGETDAPLRAAPVLIDLHF
jgi:Condensation domain/Phosphopantetheine attachment site